MLQPHRSASLLDVLDVAGDAKPSSGDSKLATYQHPLRCLERLSQNSALTVRPYRAADQYVAVSYTWPGAWTRLYSSAKPSTILRNGRQSTSEHISGFMVLVFDSLLLQHPDGNLSFWVDHACINQADEVEKSQQIAVMDRIYTQARMTVVVLEDVEMTMAEYRSLNKSGIRMTADDRQQHIALTMKVLGARWFKRAWCSQELILSRSSTYFYVHCTDEPAKPICIAVPLLVGWADRARMYDRDIPRIAEPRGHVDYERLESVAANPHAWAFSVVRKMGCYNVYDKVALVQNLVRTPLHLKLTYLPDTKGLSDTIDELNVAKILNVLAIQRGDFSLLQTGHTDAAAILQREEGFSWAGVPTKRDITSEGWHTRQYDGARDPDTALTASGLKLTGLVDFVRSQEFWSVRRHEDTLYISVGARIKVVRPDWLRSTSGGAMMFAGFNAYSREEPLSRLGDILYAIEAFDAEHIWPVFMPADGNWILRGLDDGLRSSAHGPLKERILQEYDRPSMQHRSMAQAASFCQRGDTTTFSVLTLAGGGRMVVDGNAGNVVGKELFQPHVMRLKEFGSDRIACNAVVLESLLSGQSRDRRYCVGHLRSFNLVPQSAKVETITLQ